MLDPVPELRAIRKLPTHGMGRPGFKLKLDNEVPGHSGLSQARSNGAPYEHDRRSATLIHKGLEECLGAFMNSAFNDRQGGCSLLLADH